MKKLAFVAASFALVVVPPLARAHEGHEHKAMGIVKVIDAAHVEVETTEGKKVSVTLTKETKFLKGKTAVAPADLKVGDRAVVVYVQEKGKNVARQVLLGAGAEAHSGQKQN
jgi:hypothetical protein